MPGVFIIKGMSLRVPAGGLTIEMTDAGETKARLSLHVRYDVAPTWAEIALGHANDAAARMDERVQAWKLDDEEKKRQALEAEFVASMQAVTAAAIALDAFYAVLQDSLEVPESLIANWQAKRTARYKQVTEVIRRAFKLKPAGTKALQSNLKEIFGTRDQAVHPSGKVNAPVEHPELGVGVDKRLAMFRAQNAKAIVNAATWVLWELAHWGRPANAEVERYAATLKARLEPLFPSGHPNAQLVTAKTLAT